MFAVCLSLWLFDVRLAFLSNFVMLIPTTLVEEKLVVDNSSFLLVFLISSVAMVLRLVGSYLLTRGLGCTTIGTPRLCRI